MTDDAIHDSLLGILSRLDPFMHGRHFSVEGRDVLVAIETGEGLTPEALAQARRLAGALEDLAKRARRFAAESLGDLKNETWNADEPRVLTTDELERTLSLDACEIAADGIATLYLADGGLFGGHSVIVYVGAAGDFVDAKLAG